MILIIINNKNRLIVDQYVWILKLNETKKATMKVMKSCNLQKKLHQ